jgi:hypothetical protein
VGSTASGVSIHLSAVVRILLTENLGRFPAHAALRTVKVGTKIALGYGLAQDAISVFQGRRIRYVEIIKSLWES